MIHKFSNFKCIPLFSVRMMKLIACISLLLYVVSCSSDDSTPSPSGSSSIDPIRSLTLSGVDESSITINWDLLKTEEGAVDPTIAYTVYAETTNGEGVFTKNPDTEKIYSLSSGATILPVDSTGNKAAGVQVANLTNNTPYRIVVMANDAFGNSSQARLLAYTASELTDSDISGVDVSTTLDSEEVTVTWDPKDGAQSYAIQATDGGNQFGGGISTDNVITVICPPGFLLCKNEDQFAQVEGNKLKYTFTVNHRGSRYQLAIIPFNFRDLAGLQAVDEAGMEKNFIEEVLAQVKDEGSTVGERLKNTIQDPTKVKEVQVQMSVAGAPTDLVLDSTGNTLSARWGHGIGAEYYYAILTSEGMNTVTNTIDRYDASGRFVGGGYTGFDNLNPVTSYTVTVQSLTVVSNSITNVGGEVLATLSTKDASDILYAPEKIAGGNLILTSEEGKLGIVWDTPETNSVVGYNVFYWVGEVAPTQPQYVAVKGETNLTFTVQPGNYHVRIDVLSTYPEQEVVVGETSSITVYGKPLPPQNLAIAFNRGSFTNIGNRLYVIGYPLAFTGVDTPAEAGGPLEDISYHYRYQVEGGEWVDYSEDTGEAMISLQVDDLGDANTIKGGYGKKYQVEVIASNAGGFVSDAGAFEFTYKSFPEPFIQSDHLEVETGDRSLTVTWSEVNDLNGSTVSSYTVVLSVNPYEEPVQSVTTVERVVVFKNLVNNQPYLITVIPNGTVTGNLLTALSVVTGYTIGEAIVPGSQEERILGTYTGIPTPYTPQGDPEAVVNLAVTGDADQATVTWSESSTGSPATGYVLEYLADVKTTITNIDVAGDDADTELSNLSWEGAIPIAVTTNDSGSYSRVVSNLNVLSATNVFRVKGIRSDDSEQEWESPYRYYALGTDISRAPGSMGELSFSEYTDTSFKVIWTEPEDAGQNRDKTPARLIGYKVSWGTNRAVLEKEFEITDTNTLSYTIKNLTPGTQYYVKVQAKNNNTEGYNYNTGSTGSVYTRKPPGAVSSITYSEHSTNRFKVNWDAVTDAGYGPDGAFASVGYLLDFSADQGKSWQSVPRINYAATEEALAGLTPGSRYRVRITATNGFNLFGAAPEGEDTWTLSLPGQVGGLMVSEPSYDGENHAGGFKVSWTAPLDTGRTSTGGFAAITGYEVIYAEKEGDNTGEYISHESTTNEYVFTGLKTNAEYDIRIRAKSAVGTGIEKSISGWTPSLPGIVNPGSILFSHPTANKIQIEWTAPQPGRAGGSSSSNATTLYKVEVVSEEAKENENAYILVQDDYSGITITATGLSKSTTYYARVTAKNTWGEVGASVSTDTGTTTEKDSTSPSAVENLKVVSVTNTQVYLSWSEPTNKGTTDGSNPAEISNYIVKYKTGENDATGFTQINEKGSEGIRLATTLTNTTATVIGLTPDTTYTFLVVAINSANEITSDAEAATIVETTSSAAAPPAQPSLSVSNYGADVYLNWTVEHFGSNADGSPAEFSSYLVEKENGSQWTAITNLVVNTMSYVHRVSAAGAHTYRVSVSNNATPPQGSTSAEVPVTIAAATAPGSPTAFTNSEVTSTSISLTWESPGNKGTEIGGIDAIILGYQLQYKASNDSDWTTLTVSDTSWTVENLIPLTSYDFRLYASNSGQLPTDPQAPAKFSATTASGAAPPAQPALSISNYGADVYLNWTVEHFGSNAKGIPAEFSSYLVEENDGSQWTTITNLVVNTMSYVHRGRAVGTHTYRVSVSNNAPSPQGSTSAEVSVTIAAATAPGAPTAFTNSEATTTSISLTWGSPGNAGTEIGGIPATISNYRVEYKETISNDFVPISHHGNGVHLEKALTGTSTNANVIGLDPSTSYTFKIMAVNSAEVVGPEAITSATTEAIPAPDTPTGLRIQPASTCDKFVDVALTWDAIPGAASYKLYRGGDMIKDSITTNAYTDKPAPGDYQYTVRACNSSGGCSGNSTPTQTVTIDGSFTSIVHRGEVPPDADLIKYNDEIQDVFLRNVDGSLVPRYNAGASLVARYVKVGGTGTGTSYEDASGSLKAVMEGINSSATNVYVVFVGKNTADVTTYEEGAPVVMQNHVAIVGGVKDGCLDPASDRGTTLNGGNNHRVFENDGNNLDYTALLYRVKITDGNAQNETVDRGRGGGMYNNDSSPALTRVTFSGNRASSLGGGLFNLSSSPTLTEVLFYSNVSKPYGGGMANVTSSPTLTRVTFRQNEAEEGRGGAIYNVRSSPLMVGVTFSGNTATGTAGMGAAMFNYNSSPTLIGVTFSNNSSGNYGGAMFNDNNGEPGPLIVNGIFWGNTAVSGGAQFAISTAGTGQENLGIYNSIVQGGTGGLESGTNYATSFDKGGFFSTTLSTTATNSVVISFANITNADPQLAGLDSYNSSTDLGGTILTHAITSSTSPAVNQGLYVKKEGSTYYYGMEDNGAIVWYTDPGLSVKGDPPAGAEDLTATDATGHTRTDRPDLGAYEYR